MKITRKTRYRFIGRVAYETWQQSWRSAGGREVFATRGAWDAGGELSAVVQGLAWQESKLDSIYRRNGPENLNPFNVRILSRLYPDDPRGYVRYDTAVQAVNAVRGRINGEAGYFAGANPYLATETVEQLIRTYAPQSDNNRTEALIDDLVDYLNGILPEWAGELQPVDPVYGEPVYGRGVEPYAIWRPLNKPNGSGVNWSPAELHNGHVMHETQGDPAGEGVDELNWYYNFFNCPSGERCRDAATHHVVARNGLAMTMVDPKGDVEPWINGGTAQSLTQEYGGPWLRRFGSAKRNRLLRGTENIKTKAQRLTAEQIAWNAQMSAAIADADRQSWVDYPFPAKYAGVRVLLQHGWIAQTSCSLPMDQYNLILQLAKDWLKKWQTGGATDEPVIPPATPEEPVTDLSKIQLFPGLDVALAKQWFGRLLKDGRTYELTWPLGPGATLWLERGKQTGNFAPIQDVAQFADGRLYMRFADGFTLVKGAGQELRVLKG